MNRVGILAVLILLTLPVRTLADCSASQTCTGGGTVSCQQSGSSATCSSTSNSVTCGGQTTSCPSSGSGGSSCHAETVCPSPPYSYPWALSCSGTVSCSQGATWVLCDGSRISCLSCEVSSNTTPPVYSCPPYVL